nr:receptor-like protein 7 [Ziziphus jujuba var. spinosa]
MGLSLCLVPIFCVFLKLLVLHIVVPKNITFVQSFCHDNERSSLLEFKESFLINKSGSLCDPKVLQWKSLGVNASNCCSWDGVQCDEETGRVIGLDLSRGLTYLNLSRSSFRGQIPKEISHLFKLSQLDLSFNYNENVEQKALELKNPNMSSLLQNLIGLEVLDLSYVNISSIVPNFLSNFTSLASLFLLNCGLHGEFPGTTFQLPNLRYLDVGSNRNLKGYLPEFKHKSPLKELILHKNGFSGILRSSIQMLDSLDLLDVDGCNFSGFVPSSLGKLAQLTTIHLAHKNFIGRIPSSLQNLTQLTSLYLFSNHMTGPIPPWLGNLTKLNTLLLGHNQFYGLVPQSLSDIINLETLYLRANNLSGTLKFDMFFGMKFLTNLTLGENSLSIFIMKGNKNATSSKFKRLELGSCNFNTFPNFRRHQNELEVLGTVPEICSNRASNLRIIDLSYNKLQGQLPRTLSNCSIMGSTV